MRPAWDDVNARARGLSTHLLTRGTLHALGRAPELAALASGLRRCGVLAATAEEQPTPEQLELGIRRWAGARLGLLARWVGERSAALPLVFDAEDRRSLRAIFRGIAERAPAERRLAGLIPTPALPERALEALAAAPTAAAAAALLAAWRHPLAAAAAWTGAADPDLFALDESLARAGADQARRAARRTHDAPLRNAVREAIDLDNALTAVVLATAGREVPSASQFLPGGARVTSVVFREAIATGDPGAAGVRLARALAGSAYADLFARGAGDPAALESAVLRRQLRELSRQVRRAPLGPLELIWFALRLRAQVLDLQRIIWTVALDAPRAELAGALVTAEP
ncbi:MAG TPA: V-type ATPase subunit [Gemmatimonadales bacterium]|nr:V-type ATPase subunit [Gemmatimonadales bacterium]